MKKRWIMFWLGEAAAFTVCIVLCMIFRKNDYRLWILISSGAAFIILSVLWLLYYYRLEYSRQNGRLIISSGIIFRKHRTLPPENILWEMRLTSPLFHGSAMVVLHTSGGSVVIFGDYSTKS